MYHLLALAVALALTGCSYGMQLMPRDSGKVYQGSVQSNGAGSGTLSVALDGKTCAGNFVTTSSGDSFGFVQTYGARGMSTGTAFMSGSSQYKAILSCSDGSGLRCDVSGSTSGGGICVDSHNRVYDLIYS